MGGMPEIPSPNARCKEVRKQLVIFLICFISMAVLRLIVGIFTFQDIISAMLLWCGYRSLNHCYVTFFVLMTFFTFFETFCYIGKLIQNGKPLF